MRQSIALMATWFGPWPAWIHFFLESCRANSDIDWFIFTDQEAPEDTPQNVRIVSTSLADYVRTVEERLQIRFRADVPAYKLCDIRPALGHIHFDTIKGYDFFGWTDLDLVYGNIREFYDPELLDVYDAISAHSNQISGHLFLMRNTAENRLAYRRADDWKRKVEDANCSGFDEQGFFDVFAGKRSARSWLRLGRRPRYFFKEAYSTPAPTERMRWYWSKGRLWNEFFHRDFLYLHFMSWQSSRWYFVFPEVVPGTPSPWERLPAIVQMDWRRAREDGFMIGPDGIKPIELPRYAV